MITRKDTKTPGKSKKASSVRRFGTYLLTFSCMALLAGGFFFAAHQHFSSMDYGMKNSRLRRQIDQLEAEKRRLILAKEISLSPSQIKKAAQRAGMMDPLPSDGELLTTTEPTRAKAVPAPPVIEKALVTKTAAVTPVPVRASVVLAKNDRSGKEARRTISAE